MDYESINFIPRPLRLNTNMWSRQSSSNRTIPYSQGRPSNFQPRANTVGLTNAQRAANRRAAVQRVRRGMQQFASRQRQATRVGSQTATTTLRQGKQFPSGGGGESKSFFKLIKPNRTLLGKFEVTKHSLNRSLGFASSATQGKQTAFNLGAMFNSADIVNIFTAVGQTSTGQNSAKAFLESAHARALITNAETTNVHFTIYDCMARLDGGALNTDPAATFLAGNVDAVGGAAADATIPGTSPFSNPRFVEAFKVLKKTDVILAPGQTHQHNMHYAPNRLISNERQVISGVGSGPLAGLTVWPMIIQHGTPVHGLAALTSVTLGASKLDVVTLEEIRYKVALYNYAINSITTTLATGLTGEQIYDGTDAEVLDAAP